MAPISPEDTAREIERLRRSERVTGVAQAEQVRLAIIEECAKICEDLRREDYSAETPDWSGGTFDCARAIRALASQPSPAATVETEEGKEWIVPHEDCLNCHCRPDERCAGYKEVPRSSAASEAENFARLGASEYACYRWPEDTAEHRAMRAAFMDGAAHAVTRIEPQPSAGNAVAWNCTYPTYGHITLKRHEAEQAERDGAQVRALVYADEPQPSAATEHVNWAEEDYKRSSDCMMGILGNSGWLTSDIERRTFDNAFQHAVGILSLTARRSVTGPQHSADKARALQLLAAEDARQDKLQEILETTREQIRLEVAPEHRPEGLFKNIQDAVYAMRGRTRLMDDAAITHVLNEPQTLPKPIVSFVNEVSGIWSAFEYDLRNVMGNTNYAVVQEKLDAALSLTRPKSQ